MPQKTKKQKIRTDARRVQLSSSLPTNSDIRTPSEVSRQLPSFTFLGVAPVKSISKTLPTEELTAIQSDLIKTLLLAIIAIGIELFLYIRLR